MPEAMKLFSSTKKLMEKQKIPSPRLGEKVPRKSTKSWSS